MDDNRTSGIEGVRTLLVDNDSDTWQALRELCITIGLDVTEQHVSEVRPHSADGYELAILSGGNWYDDDSRHHLTYEQELKMIQTTHTPLLGICLGMQLTQSAFEGEVPMLDEAQSGAQVITISQTGQKILGLPPELTVFKNHTRGVLNVASDFEILASSGKHAEIIRHTARPLLGVQFHPEIGDEPTRSEVFEKLIVSVLTIYSGQT